MKKSYELIVFDWDGTLHDSHGHIVATLIRTAEEFGLPQPDPEVIRQHIGLGFMEALAGVFPDLDPVIVQKMYQRFRECFYASEFDSTTLYLGTEEVLQQLKSAGYLLAIATGKSRFGLDRVLEHLQIQSMFMATRTADETHSKPHPQMLQEIMEVLGVEPEQTLMIGDTDYDIHLAANAKTDSLGVSYGGHSGEHLLASGAQHCINDIKELIPWLESINRV